MEARELEVIVSANTVSFQKGMDAVKAKAIETGAQASTLGKSFQSFGSDLSSLGSKMTMGLTLPIVGVGFAAVKMATDFQTQMTYIRTQAGDTTDSISKLSNQVLDLAHSSTFGPEELAKGLYHLTSLGLRGAEAMQGLNIAQQMATVGGAKLEETTSALGAAMVSGIKGTEDLGSAAGNLNAIVGQGNMRMEDLIGALSSGILPVAKNAGLTLTDVGAALATLTDNGMGADESATRLRMTFALMEAPSKKAQGVLKELGMTADEWALNMRQHGLIPALTELRDHLEKTYGKTDEGKTRMATALTEIFGGGRSSAAAQTLIGELDRMQTKFTAISQGGTDFSKNVGDTMQTAGAKMHVAWSSIQADLIVLGDKLLPLVAQAMQGISKMANDLANWWGKLSNSQQDLILKVAGFIALAGPILSVIGGIISVVTTLVAIVTSAAAPWVLLGVAVIGLAVLVMSNLDKIKSWFSGATNFVSSVWNDMSKNVTNAFKTTMDAVVAAVNQFKNHWVEDIGFAIGFILTLPVKALAAFMQFSQDMGNVIGNAFAAMWNTTTRTINDVVNFISRVNWGNIFSSLGRAAVDVASSIWNAISGAYNKVVNLNWGAILSSIARGIGNGLVNLLQGAINGALSGLPGAPHVSLPHFATGVTNFRGGLAIVGERGPELVNLPAGSSVIPNHQISSGQNITINITGDFRGQTQQDMSNFGSILTQQLRTAARGF